MAFDFELKYIPREQIPQADALSRMDFDKGIIYFAQSDLVIQAKVKAEPGTIRLFRDIIKTNQKAIGNNV